ncbi:MAG: hypothetical protein FJ291_31150 [Planctomycetes bacterium]|nr:hypothetical protein [Planctomycetota bacterium]
MRTVVAWACGVAVLLASSVPPLAGEAAPEKKAATTEPKPPQPVHVWADRIKYVQEKNLAYITGNATVIKGDMRIDADDIVADLDQKTNELRKMTATGNVRVNTVEPIAQRTTDRPPLKTVPDGRSAECDKATYDAAAGLVVLHGTPQNQPVVHMGKDVVRANLITFDRIKNTVLFDGQARLTAFIPVKSEEAAPSGKGAPPKEAPPSK